MSQWIYFAWTVCIALSGPAKPTGTAPATSTAPADGHPGYTTRAQHDEHGIGKFYMGREIAHVMSHAHAEWLERPEREKEEHGQMLLNMLKVRPGDVVVDLGAGSGYYTFPLARMVSPTGRVKAVEIQQEMLDLIRKKQVETGVDNIDLVLGTEDDPKLPPESVDMILLVDVYHEFEWPFEMTRHMFRALRPGGRIIFVEFRAEDPKVPILAVHKMSEAQVIKEMRPHGLKHKETLGQLPRQHVIVFERPIPGSRPAHRQDAEN